VCLCMCLCVCVCVCVCVHITHTTCSIWSRTTCAPLRCSVRHIYPSIYLSIHPSIYLYIYIYRERERERDIRIHTHAYKYLYIYIYLYIYRAHLESRSDDCESSFAQKLLVQLGHRAGLVLFRVQGLGFRVQGSGYRVLLVHLWLRAWPECVECVLFSTLKVLSLARRMCSL
jgi:hypothetical protein